MKNHTRDMHQPPDISQTVLRVTPDTRVSNADQPVALTEFKPGDILRMNLTSE